MASVASAQTPAQPSALTLRAARAMALAASPELMAAREAVAAARGRARQAGVHTNPVLSYAREQTSGGGSISQHSAQDIVSIDQPIDWNATRGARSDAARLRGDAAAARVAALETQISFDVARAYATAVAADRRAALADSATRAFEQARTVSERRLAAGDVSGFATRRIRLEAGRYATVRAEARLASRSARIALVTMLSRTGDASAIGVVLADSLGTSSLALSADSLVAIALMRRADLKATELDAAAVAADARVARRERTPVPTLTAGAKLERAPGAGSLAGFVAGLSVPVPIWDNRAGAIEAADAEGRRRQADLLAARRQVGKEVREALENVRATEEQLASLNPQLEADASAALRSAQAAYAEGEITLLEWLDAVRAYHETESALAGLRADLFIRRAALARVVGLSYPENQP